MAMAQASNLESKSQNSLNQQQTLLHQFNTTILPGLRKHPQTLTLCRKILRNVLKHPTDKKFQSINDQTVAKKCDSDEYVIVSNFLKFIGFKRSQREEKQNDLFDLGSTVTRWEFQHSNELASFSKNTNNTNNTTNSTNNIEFIQLLSKILNSLTHESSNIENCQAANNWIQTFPRQEGTLIQGGKQCQLWCLKQLGSSIFSVNNEWNRGTNWGNFYCTINVINLMGYNDIVYIYWINRAGYIARNPTSTLKFGESTNIRAQLGHPHIFMRSRIRRPPNMDLTGKVLNNESDFLGGYNPTIRSIKYDGNHCIIIGKVKNIKEYFVNYKYNSNNNYNQSGYGNNFQNVNVNVKNLSINQILEEIAIKLMEKAGKDTREAPRFTPTPTPPRPADRRGKFWGGR